MTDTTERIEFYHEPINGAIRSLPQFKIMMMISSGDLAVFLFAVGIVIAFFFILRRTIAKAEKAERSED